MSDAVQPPVIPQNAGQLSTNETTTPYVPEVITGGVAEPVPVPPGSTLDYNVTPGNPSPITSTHLIKSMEPTGLQEPDKTATTVSTLPQIDIFMTQHCMIPLIRCDFQSALKAADNHNKESAPDDSAPTKPLSSLTPNNEHEPWSETCTSGRTRMVIDYKKFLEHYADDVPPPLPKK